MRDTTEVYRALSNATYSAQGDCPQKCSREEAGRLIAGAAMAVLKARDREVERATIAKVANWVEELEKSGRLTLKKKSGLIYKVISSGHPEGWGDRLKHAKSVSWAIRFHFGLS